MKFSAQNVDLNSLSPDPLSLRRPAQAGVKDGYSSKKWLFCRNYFVYSVKTVAYRYRHGAYHNKHG